MLNSSIWPIGRNLSRATTPGRSRPSNDADEGLLRIPQTSNITEASSSDCFVSYPDPLLGEGSYLSSEMYTLFSSTPADRDGNGFGIK